MSSRIVLIGPADSLATLRQRLDPAAEVQAFADTEALEALDHITRTKPALIAMQDEFSDTSRGQALINRITDDPNLTCEVRVLARDASQNRVAVKRGATAGGAAVALQEPRPALEQKGTRRAPRVRIKDGVEIAIDGSPATLVDLSTVGAQVVSPTVLKPNQRVRIVLGDAKSGVRCAGAVSWAAFEMPKGLPTRYRAGIEWGTSADAAALELFAKKNKKE